jgi:uncharacterized protein YcfJ
MTYIVALIFGIIGFLLGWIFSSQKRSSTKLGASHGGFISEQSGNKEQNKKAIFELLETNHPLTNDDVEKMLGISDATATRYFEELEKEGKVRLPSFITGNLSPRRRSIRGLYSRA